MSDLTPEQFAYWREHPDLVSGSFRVVEDSHSLEIETWLTLREAYLGENFGDQPIHLRGTIWAVDMGLATAWCQTTSHHEPVFLVHAFDHVSAQERWFAVTQAVAKPGISEEERHDSEAVLTTWDETSDVSDVTVDVDAEERGSSGSTGTLSSEEYLESPRRLENNLWGIRLSRQEYLDWRHPTSVDLVAEGQFRVILGETSIVIGVEQALNDWEIEYPAFDVHLSETQVIREAVQIMTMFTDGVLRSCTVCWVMDLEANLQQFLAFAREPVPPMIMRLRDRSGAMADVCNHGAPPHHKSGILLDSGANEVLRQHARRPPRSTPLPLTLANGQTIDAFRTREGEVVSIGNDSEDVICGINRLVQVGCLFMWDTKGPRLKLPKALGAEWLNLTETNGLPYVDKHTFARLRPLMTKFWKSQSRCASISAGLQEETNTNPFVSLEEMLVAAAEVQVGSRAETEVGEHLAEQLLQKGHSQLKYDTVRRVIQDSNLEPIRCRRSSGVVTPIRAWTFGAFSYDHNYGITAGTGHQPWLTKLLNALLRKVVPDTCWTTMILNDGITYKPHKDANNQRGSVNVIVCLDGLDYGTGGGIWIAEKTGMTPRRISSNLKLKGTIYDIRHRPLRFDPSQWHGTEPWQGSRLSATAFTIGGWERLSGKDRQRLEQLGFPLPDPLATEERLEPGSSSIAKQASVPSSPQFPCEDATLRALRPQPNEEVSDPREFEASGCDEELEFLPMGCAGKFVGLESSHGFPLPAVDLDPDEPAPLMAGPSVREKREPVGHSLEDFMARGLRKPHRRVKSEDLATGAMSIDLAGPYKLGLEKVKYALVAVFRLHEGGRLYFVRWLTSRHWQGVARAVQSIIAEITSLAGEKFSVVRLHSDKGRELVTERLAKEVEALGIFKTTTAGYNPQSNGQAERAIGYLKTVATGFLIKGKLGTEYWPYAMVEAARRQRDETLGVKYQGTLPQPGEPVAVSVAQPGPFEAKAERGRFLARNDTVSGGAYVEVTRNGRQAVITTRLPAVLEKHEQTWSIHETPSGDKIWVSSRGEVKDAENMDNLGKDLGLLTLEERTDGPNASEDASTACWEKRGASRPGEPPGHRGGGEPFRAEQVCAMGQVLYAVLGRGTGSQQHRAIPD